MTTICVGISKLKTKQKEKESFHVGQKKPLNSENFKIKYKIKSNKFIAAYRRSLQELG